MARGKKVQEYRGCRHLVYAEVLRDDEEAYEIGPIYDLAPVRTISKSVESSSETGDYDDVVALEINSEGADAVTFEIGIPSDEVMADLEGRRFDSEKGLYLDVPQAKKNFAIAYVNGEVGDDEDETYVWKYKGKFTVGEQVHATKGNNTNRNNLSLSYNNVFTKHNFANARGENKPAPMKGTRTKASYGKYTEEEWFSRVITYDEDIPETFVLAITQAEGTTVTVKRNNVALANGAALVEDDVLTITVTGGTVTVNGEAFTSGNTITVESNVIVISAAEA